MVNFCAIVGCSNKSTKDTSLTLYRFPQISKHAKSTEQELQKKRRALWIERIKRDDVKEGNINYFRICANHFLKGKPADLLDEDNPDWAPCINMGYETIYDKQKKRNDLNCQDSDDDIERHRATEVRYHEDNISVTDKNSSDDDSVKCHGKAMKVHVRQKIKDADADVIEDRNSSDDDSVQCLDKNKKNISHDALKMRDEDNDLGKNDDNSSNDGSLKHSGSSGEKRHHDHHDHNNYIDLGNNLVGRSDGVLNNDETSKHDDRATKKHHDHISSNDDSLKQDDSYVKHHHGSTYIDLGNNLIGKSISKNTSDTILNNDESSKRQDRAMKKHHNDGSSSKDDSMKHKESDAKRHHEDYIDLGNNLIGRSFSKNKSEGILNNDESSKRQERSVKKNRVENARDVDDNSNHKNNRSDDSTNNDSKNKRRPRVVKAVKTHPLPAAKRQFLNAQSLISKAMAAGTVSPERSPQRKPLDVNKYATKKTIAQGMLDIALLTANASQLKYILQVGEKHEFYSLMLALISISIILQVAVGVLSILLTQFDIKKADQEVVTEVLNHASLGFSLLAMVSDVIKMSFGLDPALSFKDYDRYRNITRK